MSGKVKIKRGQRIKEKMVKQKKTLINLRTNEWKGALSRPTRGYLMGAHYDTFSGGSYCAEKEERVLPRGIFGVPSFLEEDPALFCTRKILRWIEVVKGFPNAQTRCKSVKSLMRYGEFRLGMMFQSYFRFSGTRSARMMTGKISYESSQSWLSNGGICERFRRDYFSISIICRLSRLQIHSDF